MSTKRGDVAPGRAHGALGLTPIPTDNNPKKKTATGRNTGVTVTAVRVFYYFIIRYADRVSWALTL